MKKTKEFLILPLTQILVGFVGLITGIIGGSIDFVNIPVSIAIYIAAGYFFSKVESKRTKAVSAIAAILLIAAAYIAIIISAEYSNTDDFYMLLFISPFTIISTNLANLVSDMPILIYVIVILICSVCPVLVTVLSSKLFVLKEIKDVYSSK